jgi:hypothetical protein
MHIEMNEDELEVLTRNLDRQIQVLQDEVVHTDRKPLRTELAREVEALEHIRQKLRPRAGEPVTPMTGPLI